MVWQGQGRPGPACFLGEPSVDCSEEGYFVAVLLRSSGKGLQCTVSLPDTDWVARKSGIILFGKSVKFLGDSTFTNCHGRLRVDKSLLRVFWGYLVPSISSIKPPASPKVSSYLVSTIELTNNEVVLTKADVNFSFLASTISMVGRRPQYQWAALELCQISVSRVHCICPTRVHCTYIVQLGIMYQGIANGRLACMTHTPTG